MQYNTRYYEYILYYAYQGKWCNYTDVANIIYLVPTNNYSILYLLLIIS